MENIKRFSHFKPSKSRFTIALLHQYVYKNGMDKEQELLCRIAYEILQTTDQVVSEGLSEEHLLSAPELAKRLSMKLDKLKRKLKSLKQDNLIRPISLSPKRYRFDRYTLERLPEEHFLFNLDNIGFEASSP